MLRGNSTIAFHKSGIRAANDERTSAVSSSVKKQVAVSKYSTVERGPEQGRIQCFKCGRKGHRAGDCSASPKQENTHNGEEQEDQRDSFSA